MNKKNTAYQVELVFSEKQTLKELLLELLIENIYVFDSNAPPV